MLGFLLALQSLRAQSKVFKEVSEDISSKMEPIIQDQSLVGYLVFTQLEKASEDSFNYKISIMDENLNDIGSVNFKEEQLYLEDVSFEQDVICLAYMKSNVIGKKFANQKEYNKTVNDENNGVLIQFLGLDGKIIKSNTYSASIAHDRSYINNSKFIVT